MSESTITRSNELILLTEARFLRFNASRAREAEVVRAAAVAIRRSLTTLRALGWQGGANWGEILSSIAAYV